MSNNCPIHGGSLFIGKCNHCYPLSQADEKVEEAVFIPNEPLMVENITIDQRYKFEQEITALQQKVVGLEEKYQTTIDVIEQSQKSIGELKHYNHLKGIRINELESALQHRDQHELSTDAMTSYDDLKADALKLVSALRDNHSEAHFLGLAEITTRVEQALLEWTTKHGEVEK